MRSGILQKRGLSIHEYLSANLLESVWDCSLSFFSVAPPEGAGYYIDLFIY